jgi:hypothetical protein
MNNTSPSRFTAAAGTGMCRGFFFELSHHQKNLDERVLQHFYKSLHHSRDIAGSKFPPLSKIPHCCTLIGAVPFLNSGVVVHSLKSTKDH